MDRAFGAARVSHGTVMQLDLIVREHPVSPALRMPSAPEADIPLRLALQRATALILPQKRTASSVRQLYVSLQGAVLMYLHRGFYARAMGEDAADPLASAFRASVLACFRAALYITSTMRALAQDAQAGTFCARLPSLWSAAFSASVSRPLHPSDRQLTPRPRRSCWARSSFAAPRARSRRARGSSSTPCTPSSSASRRIRAP